MLMGGLAMPMGGLAMPMGGLARIVPGRGTNFLHRTSRTSTDFSVRLDFSSAGEIRPQFGWICNPAVVNIRIFNPGFALFIALQMLIFNTVGLQIRPNGKSDRTGNPTEREIRPNGNPTERESDRTGNPTERVRSWVWAWVRPWVWVTLKTTNLIIRQLSAGCAGCHLLCVNM